MRLTRWLTRKGGQLGGITTLIMNNQFEDFLKEWHAVDYHGTDDDMPEAFEAWLDSLEQQTLIELAEVAMQRAHLAGFREAQKLAATQLAL